MHDARIESSVAVVGYAIPKQLYLYQISGSGFFLKGWIRIFFRSVGSGVFRSVGTGFFWSVGTGFFRSVGSGFFRSVGSGFFLKSRIRIKSERPGSGSIIPLKYDALEILFLNIH